MVDSKLYCVSFLLLNCSSLASEIMPLPDGFDSSADADAQLQEEEDQLIKGLTMAQRIQGFLLFFSLALFSAMLSWVAMGMGKFWKYTALSSLGTILSIVSTFLLMGPSTQLEYMMDEHRKLATIMYCCSVVVSFFSAIIFKSFFICLITTGAQYICLLWYSLSYVPYGREIAMSYLFK